MASIRPPSGAPPPIWLPKQHDILAPASLALSISQAPVASTARISPSVLAVVLILACVFFISALLHLFLRFKYSNSSSPPSDQQEHRTRTVDSRQLQQLFRLHDSGLDQSLIDSLPVFSFRSVLGPRLGETFDCPVCLSEFVDYDKLRFLPNCAHAFHQSCIDTGLFANSTCPLCRGSIVHEMHGLMDIMYDNHLDDGSHGNDVRHDDGHDGFSKVFSLKLGKFKRIIIDGHQDELDDYVIGASSGSSASVDGRRCFSMGSFEYVVGEPGLRVKLAVPPPLPGGSVDGLGVAGGLDMEGRRLNRRSRGDSFSFSKIWLWPKGDPVTDASCVRNDA